MIDGFDLGGRESHLAEAECGVFAEFSTELPVFALCLKQGRAVEFRERLTFGNLGAGAMAGIIGPRDTLLLGGIGCLVGAAVFVRQLPKIRMKVRPIYERMGIYREVATGMESAAEQPTIQENR